MRVLIIGSGAREHAVAWKFSKSNRISGLFIAPGNGGTAELGTNLDIDPVDFDKIIKACKDYKIDHVFVGPEAPLSEGLVDALLKADISAIGASKSAARLESSKTFSKSFMVKHKIPTAEAKEFKSYKKFESYMKDKEGMWVIKKNGLAAGKGVLESDNMEELLTFGKSILETDTLLVEEYLTGYEISIFALLDGKNFIILPPCADFKKAGEKDTGPNTGGMGSICPVPWVNSQLLEEINKEVIQKTMKGIEKEKLHYKGVLFFGLMITDKGPKLLEYNVRFGDPEIQALLPVIKTDFGNLIAAMSEGTLDNFPAIQNTDSGVCVVIAAEGYPGSYSKGLPVTFKNYDENRVKLFHASTTLNEDKKVLTGGGRCFSVVGIGKDTISAATEAYDAIDIVSFEGSWYRSDIGKKFFIEEE